MNTTRMTHGPAPLQGPSRPLGYGGFFFAHNQDAPDSERVLSSFSRSHNDRKTNEWSSLTRLRRLLREVRQAFGKHFALDYQYRGSRDRLRPAPSRARPPLRLRIPYETHERRLCAFEQGVHGSHVKFT